MAARIEQELQGRMGLVEVGLRRSRRKQLVTAARMLEDLLLLFDAREAEEYEPCERTMLMLASFS